jgi:hypothetical protein
MKSLAISIAQMCLSQEKTLLVSSINGLVIERNVDCSIFHSDFGPLPIQCLASMYQLCEMWDFTGTVITTDFNIARQLINCPGPSKKFFYIWDFSWTRVPKLVYNNVADVYCNNSLELIARTEDHNKVLTQCFKKPKYILDDWNIDQLEQII